MPKVFINPGHGGSDPGAVENGMTEKDIVLVISKECKKELERHGVEVVMSRDTDETEELYEICQEANSSGSDVFVSIHVNAGGGDGFEIYSYPGSAEGQKLAEKFGNELVSIGQNLRSPYIKDGSWLYVIKNTTMPAVLCESFFIDNQKDAALANTEEKQKKFGVAYAKAILNYFSISYRTNSSETTNNDKEKCKVDLPLLKKNSEGNSVLALQTLLIGKGYDCGGFGADSIFGDGTEVSVKEYQKHHGIYPDGLVGVKTWSSLLL